MKKTMMILSCVMGLSFSAMATANTGNTMQQPPAANQPSANVSEGKLQKFAKAHKDVMQIQQKYQQKLQNTKDEQAAQKLQKKAYNEMNKAVESKGLTAEQYSKIAQKVQQSPQLQQKIQKLQ